MDTLFELLELLGPAVAAALTVPILQGLKSISGLVDNAPAWAKRILAVLIAFGLTKAGQAINLALPTELALFTGDTVEALVAAALAMAMHAGNKQASPSTVRALLVVAMMALPAAAACQTGRGTVIVVDRSRLTVVVTPATFTGEVGDTVRFSAIAIDTISGDTIPSVFTWSSLNEQGVSIEPTTGLARLLRAGTYEVEAFVEQIVSMIITRQMDDGSWREVFTVERQAVYAATGVVPPRLEIEVGQEVPLCAYLEGSSGLHFVCTDCEWGSDDPAIATVSDGDPSLCPTWAPGLPFPSSQAAIPIPLELFRRGRLGE